MNESPPDPSADSRTELTQECRTYARYLVRSEPNEYVVRSYVDAHAAPALARPARGIDRTLMRVSGWHPWGTALADAYAGLFVRTGLLRSKLVLLFGILEATPPYHTTLDRIPRGGVLRLVGLGIAGALVGLLATVVFAPVHLAGGSTNDA